MQDGCGWPSRCSLKREQNRYKHGRRYSAPRTPLTRPELGGISEQSNGFVVRRVRLALLRFSMRLVRSVIPVLAMFSLITLPLSAQGGGTVRGQVTDSVTKQGLPAATVSIVGKQRITQTGPDGNYTLNDVPAGTAVVRVTLIGYAPQQQSVTVTAGGTADAQFGLAPQASLLEPVVVTG